MLIRHSLVTLLLVTLILGSTPAASVLLASSDDATRHSSDQPLKDGDEQNEESKAEQDQVEVLFCGFYLTELEQPPVVHVNRHDEAVCLSEPVLSGPDHSRAPPARI